MQRPAESKGVIREAVERLATRLHPLKIILYGSRAQGELEMAQRVCQAVLKRLP